MSGTGSSDLTDRPPDRRKLIAVLYADMVAYSRLIGLDDTGTIERLRRLRNTLIDPAIAEHGGRVVQTAGDSLLIVFDSIDGAVRCAVKVQQQVPSHDGHQPPDRAIRFRIGINIGDAIPDGTDLHGEAINVAARLQAECPPGGICVSRSVRDHVHGRLGLGFDELGALNLKNIARPVEAFALRLDGTKIIPKSAERPLAQGTVETLPLPDRPSIAVLPFTNMSGDPQQEYFSDGIADDIITELSRDRALFVIARNSSFIYKGHAIDVKQIGRELGVRYVLEGSVRRSVGQVRVVAQLVAAENGNHIWADRYDRALEGVFAVQDEITEAVTIAITPAIADAEQQRALRKPPGNLDAWSAYQRGLWHLGQHTANDNELAGKFFQHAIDLDPTFPRGYTGLAAVLDRAAVVYYTRDLAEATSLGESYARQAIRLDSGDAEAHSRLATMLVMRGDHQGALDEAERALAISPNLAGAYGARGVALLYSGQPSQGLVALQECLRRDPRSEARHARLQQSIIAHYLSRQYAAAVGAAYRSIRAFPNNWPNYRWLAAALGQLGRNAEGKEVLEKAIASAPSDFEMNVRHRRPWLRPEDYEHMLDGLRKAGWQG